VVVDNDLKQFFIFIDVQIIITHILQHKFIFGTE